MDDETQTTGTDAPAQDTASPQTSEADVQIESKAPEATQAQEGQPEVKAEDTAEEKLYAGKYKTVEDLEKSYQELQSKFGKETSEKAELTRILNEAFADPSPGGTVDTYEETNPLQEKVERIERQGAVQNFIFSHPDADPNGMQEILTKDPLVQQIQGHDAKLEYAYLKSQNKRSAGAIEEAKKTAATAAQVKVVEKQAAQVESAQKAAQTDENSELYEKATGNYNQETRDAARRALIRKNLVNL